MAVAPELLEILVCPKCKGDIHLNDEQDSLICDTCRLVICHPGRYSHYVDRRSPVIGSGIGIVPPTVLP